MLQDDPSMGFNPGCSGPVEILGIQESSRSWTNGGANWVAGRVTRFATRRWIMDDGK